MGSVFFIAIVVVVLLIAGVFLTPLFLIPAAGVVVFALVAGPVMAMIDRSRPRGGGPSGVPTTGEASYDPVEKPEGT